MKKRFTEAHIIGCLGDAEAGLPVTRVLDRLALERGLPLVLRTLA